MWARSVGVKGKLTGVGQVCGYEGKVDRCGPGLWV